MVVYIGSISVFHFDADPDPYRHQTMRIYLRILPKVLHMLEKRVKKTYIYSQQYQFTMFPLSPLLIVKMCEVVYYFGQQIKIFC
jgi:hypothetical protein